MFFVVTYLSDVHFWMDYWMGSFPGKLHPSFISFTCGICWVYRCFWIFAKSSSIILTLCRDRYRTCLVLFLLLRLVSSTIRLSSISWNGKGGSCLFSANKCNQLNWPFQEKLASISVSFFHFNVRFLLLIMRYLFLETWRFSTFIDI